MHTVDFRVQGFPPNDDVKQSVQLVGGMAFQ